MLSLIPYRNLLGLKPRNRDLFNEIWQNDFPVFFDDSPKSLSWTPRADIEETKDAYIVHSDLPGLNKDDVKIKLEDNVLTISGERKHESENKDKNFHRVERFYGSFQRAFALPKEIHGDKIKADYKNGVLDVIIPKSEQAKPREIEIQ